MIEFLKIQYRLKRITETQLSSLVAYGKITQDGFDKILQAIEDIKNPQQGEGLEPVE